MTADEFSKIIREPYRWLDKVHFVLTGGMVLFFSLVCYSLTDFPLYWRLFFGSLLLCIALYIFWRIPKDYEVKSVESNKPIGDKLKIIENYLATLNPLSVKDKDGYIEAIYKPKFLLHDEVFNIYVDDEKILFNAIATQYAKSRGVIDLGQDYRESKKLEKYLKEHL